MLSPTKDQSVHSLLIPDLFIAHASSTPCGQLGVPSKAGDTCRHAAQQGVWPRTATVAGLELAKAPIIDQLHLKAAQSRRSPVNISRLDIDWPGPTLGLTARRGIHGKKQAAPFSSPRRGSGVACATLRKKDATSAPDCGIRNFRREWTLVSTVLPHPGLSNAAATCFQSPRCSRQYSAWNSLLPEC